MGDGGGALNLQSLGLKLIMANLETRQPGSSRSGKDGGGLRGGRTPAVPLGTAAEEAKMEEEHSCQHSHKLLDLQPWLTSKPGNQAAAEVAKMEADFAAAERLLEEAEEEAGRAQAEVSRIPFGVASPVSTNHAAKESVFVNLRGGGRAGAG